MPRLNSATVLEHLVVLSLARLREFEPPEGYYLAFSGGKDSVVLHDLVRESGVRFDAHFNRTTIEPPELVSYVRECYPSVEHVHFPRSFFQLLPHRGMPSPLVRWCCREFREQGGRGRIVLTGVRALEGVRRARRKVVELCYRQPGKRIVNPIVDWPEQAVWQYVATRGLRLSGLYREGFSRIGCVLCPLAARSVRARHADRWPKFLPAFRLAFSRLHANWVLKGHPAAQRWPTADAMLHWYIYGGRGRAVVG